MADEPSKNIYEFQGGELCLDFANTVGSHSSDHPNERVRTYPDLLAWSRQATLISNREEADMLRAAAAQSTRAEMVLTRAHQLREAIFHVFTASATGRIPAADDLAIVNSEVAEAYQHSRVARAGTGFGWRWVGETEALERMLWPVARSAADLLVSGNLSRVRNCANATCGWLFYDTSRNNSRRWCAMSDCGNRAKVRRHYQRQRAAKR